MLNKQNQIEFELRNQIKGYKDQIQQLKAEKFVSLCLLAIESAALIGIGIGALALTL